MRIPPMNRLQLLALVGWVSQAWCQLPTPRLETILPVTVPAGGSTAAVITGANVDGIDGYLTSRTGVAGKVDKGLQLTLSADADAAGAIVDVFALGRWGLSNPRAILVTPYPNRVEKEPNSLANQAETIAVATGIDGLINGKSDVDYFTLPLAADERVTIDCFARRLDSKLNAVLTLFDPAGRILTISPGNEMHDPSIHVVAKKAGEHRIRIHDLTFDGSPQHFYHLQVHRQPTVLSVHPPVVTRTGTTTVEIFGHLLPGGTDSEKAAGLQRISLPLNVSEPTLLADDGWLLPRQFSVAGIWHRLQPSAQPTLIGVTDQPLMMEKEDNNAHDSAMPINLPATIVGSFSSSADIDYYRFSATKGTTLALETWAERLGYSLDVGLAVLKHQPAGAPGSAPARFLSEYDDLARGSVAFRFDTATHDPVGIFSAPEDGEYLLEVRYRGGQADNLRHRPYAIEVGPPRPDFALAVIAEADAQPTAFTLAKGGNTALRVVVQRRQQFSAPVTVTLVDPPAGVKARPTFIPANADEGVLVIETESSAPDWAGPLTIIGTSPGASGRRHRACAGVYVWPANNPANPRPSRLSRAVLAAVKSSAPAVVGVSGMTETSVLQKESVSIPITVHRHWDNLAEPLTGLKIFPPIKDVDIAAQNVEGKSEIGEVKLTLKPTTPPGVYSIVVSGTMSVSFLADANNPKSTVTKANVNLSSPPIILTVEPVLLEWSPPATIAVAAGNKTGIKVSVKRLNGFDGPLTVSLTPPATAGLTITSVAIPAGKNEANLDVVADKEAPKLTYENLDLTIVGRHQDREAKFSKPIKLTVQ